MVYYKKLNCDKKPISKDDKIYTTLNKYLSTKVNTDNDNGYYSYYGGNK